MGTAILLLASCASKGPYQINLMPAPDVYDDKFSPLLDYDAMKQRKPKAGILYATDRAPADEEDKKEGLLYSNHRGELVRLGRAVIGTGDKTVDWEEARRISILKNRAKDYPLSVQSVEEYGVLDRSYNMFMENKQKADDPHAATEKYTAEINEKLAVSKNKDIYIYVHGYNNIFDEPILVAAELWHFMGYDGVFIAYSWPSTPKALAYFSDAETTMLSSYHLRRFVEYLAEDTDVERIHLLGYSQGTRLVVETVYNLALINKYKSEEQINKDTKIGRVILVSSDVDLDVFATYILDGFLNVPTYTSAYVSGADKILGMSNFALAGRVRLGQAAWQESVSLSEEEREAVLTTIEDKLTFVNVTQLEGATSGRGHDYFRQSPWASSDILMSLMHDLTPADRGLVKAPGKLSWTFPADYIQRLRNKLEELYPEMFQQNSTQ